MDLLADGRTSEIELRRIVRDLEKDKKAAPGTPGIRAALGVALFRLGKRKAGIEELWTGFRMDRALYKNLVLALVRDDQVGDALKVRIEADTSESSSEILPLYFLQTDWPENASDFLDDSELETARQVELAGLKQNLRDLLIHLFVALRIDVNEVHISSEWEDGDLTIDIACAQEGDPVELANASVALSKSLCERFSGAVLTRIVPRLEALPDGTG